MGALLVITLLQYLKNKGLNMNIINKSGYIIVNAESASNLVAVLTAENMKTALWYKLDRDPKYEIFKTISKEIKEFVDDLTPEELDKGFEFIRDTLLSAGFRDTLNKYFETYAKEAGDEKALKYYKWFKKYDIDKARDEVMVKDVVYNKIAYQNREKDRAVISQILTTYAASKKLPDDFTYIASNNSKIPMKYEDLEALAKAMNEAVSNATFKARELKDQVDKAADRAAVDLIKWNSDVNAGDKNG